MDSDLDTMTHENLVDEVKKLRSAIRKHHGERTLLASSCLVGYVTRENGSCSVCAGVAEVHGRVCEV